MKINRVNSISEIYKKNKISRTNKSNKSAKDSIELSSMAKDLGYATAIGKKIPDVRIEKVDDIKNRIATNNYNIEGREVAKKMLQSGFDYKI